MKFRPIAEIRKIFADIKRSFLDLFNQRPTDEAQFDRQVDNHLEYLMKTYEGILPAFIKNIQKEIREGGRLYAFGQSEFWPVFKELLDGLIFQAAAGNLNLYVAPEIQKQNAALADAALIIQAVVDGHIEECDLDKLILEKCLDSLSRIEIKRNLNKR